MSSITLDAPPASSGSPPSSKTKNPVVQFFAGFASLRLTVILFVLSFLLVFFGTIAQIDLGIWTVVRLYFRSFIVWVPFNLFSHFGIIFLGFPAGLRLPGSFPFPAGWTLASLLMVNLLAAHFVRFKLSWKRSGILITHIGLIIMLLGEIITGLYAIEGNMIIEEGQTVNAVNHNRVAELSITDSSDKSDDKITTVPARLLSQQGKTISHKDLPFDIMPVSYMVNSEIEKAGGLVNPATVGAGLADVAVEKAEVSGVATKQYVDVPSCYMTLIDKKTGEEMGTYLFSVHLDEQTITVDGKKYDVGLRFKQTYRPYSLTLLKFTFKRYEGTETALDFASEVRLDDPRTGEQRTVTIRMNEPLRYDGETFFQADWNKRTERGTVLQVVRNPAWQLPYWSCAIVAIGLMLHFLVTLGDFLGKRGA